MCLVLLHLPLLPVYILPHTHPGPVSSLVSIPRLSPEAPSPGLGRSPGGANGYPLQNSCPSPSLRACSNSCPLSWWCHPSLSFSVGPFSSCLQSFPASGSFPINQFFASGDQSTEASASASVLPVNTQDWLPLGLTGLISLQSKWFSRVFSKITVQKHQFFNTQPSLWSNSHIHSWLLEKNHSFD